MVNVNKNIVPGKLAESSAKTEPQAPARRPRNQELNSSKKLPESIKDRRKQKLNCSREQVIDQLVNEEQIYTQEEAEELIDAFEEQTGATVERLATMDEVDNYDGEFWATRDGVTELWCRGNGFWYPRKEDRIGEDLDSACGDKSDIDSACGDKSDLDSAEGDGTASGIITLYDDFAKLKDFDIEKLIKERVTRMIPDADVTIEKLNDTQMKVTVKCADADTTRAKLAVESSDVTKSVDWENNLNNSLETDETVETEESNLNCSEDESEDIKIITESGNEVSMREIKVVQDPNTNELALFIPENEDDVIPEGFTVIGDVVSAAPVDVSAEETEESEETEVSEEDLDSAKQSVNSSVSHPNRAARRRRNNSKKKELNSAVNGTHALRDLAGYYDEHDFLTELIRTLEAMNLDNKVYHALTEGAEFDTLDSSRDAGDVSDFITRIKTELSALPAVLIKNDDSSITITGIDRGNGPVDYDTRIRLTEVEDPESVRIEETGETTKIAQLAWYLSDELGIPITTVNSALGSEDDRQDLASTVTVPDDFPEDKLIDLISWVQSELANEEYDLDIYCVSTPSSGIVEFDYELQGGTDPTSVDVAIENAVQEFIDNDYEGLSYLDEDPRVHANSNLNCAISEVQVPETFTQDQSKAFDLRNIVENELWDRGFDIEMRQVSRPSATILRFGFDGPDSEKQGEQIDAAIEGIVKSLVDTGWSDSSDADTTNLSCSVENTRIEKTPQGTFVVKADTDRFGKDAILYEHYSYAGAKKYLEKLRKGGDAVANGYSDSVDLDSDNGTKDATLDEHSISQAMATAIKEDKDTPLVVIKLDNGGQAYLQPAGYDDNKKVVDGDFANAKVYVSVYNKNFKSMLPDGKMDMRMLGSEAVAFIKNILDTSPKQGDGQHAEDQI